MTYVIGPANTDVLLPEPTPEEVRYTVISVDDHLVEPPDMFEGRLPSALQPMAPHLIENDRGHQVWKFDDQVFTQVGLNAVAGRKIDPNNLEPSRFEDMRRGCWDVHARIADMDVCGIWASMNFPSQVTGFCGRVFSAAKDRALGLAVTQAWNDWLYEEWYLAYPQRIIPMGITYFGDAELGAAEIRRNAARGFTSVTLPERPHAIGFPSLFEGWWDPIIEAVETGTVISLHVGSSGTYPMPPGAPILHLGATLFGQLSLSACTEWLWSKYPLRYPELQIAMSEGGIGWVPMLIDRLDIMGYRNGYTDDWPVPPSEVLRRNFWFCTFDDPSTIDLRHLIGVDHIMVEVDYPHGDSIWPHVQRTIGEAWGHIPNDELRQMCSLNAAKLYRHPLPSLVLP
jgi:predicted TIM-barrel fold metal-dependent hydrolase